MNQYEFDDQREWLDWQIETDSLATMLCDVEGPEDWLIWTPEGWQ